MSRVTTYLNFTRNTEEAFNFYKPVFGGEFGSMGIARFGDISAMEAIPGCGSCRPELKAILDSHVNVIKKEDELLVT